jgi:general stress protein YciG
LKGKQGFENFPKEQLREVASKGGQNVPEEARERAGKIGGLVSRGGLSREEAREQVDRELGKRDE